jgi:hypothetical protein
MVLAATMGIALAAEAGAADLPTYLVRFAAQPPRVDGRLEEAAWAEAPWSRDFAWVDAGDPAPVGSRFKAVYGREGLYFGGVFAGEALPPGPLDPDLPRACEVFLDPQGRGQTYLEYAVSPEGVEHAVVWHGRLSMQSWKGSFASRTRSAVTRQALPDGGEAIAYAICFPWTALRALQPQGPLPPPRGTAWRANFSRVETGRFAGDFTWAPCGYYYLHTPNTFGWLVFAGEHNDLRPLPPLRPSRDVSERITGSPRFRLLSRIYWTRFPLLPARDGGFWAVTKCSVSELNRDGRVRFTRTRRDGLPQFIRSLAPTTEGLYVAGDGLAAGLAVVGSDGSVRRLGVAAGLALDGLGRVVALDEQTCLVAAGDRVQVVRAGRFLPPARVGGNVLSACGLAGGRVAVGMTEGVEVLDGEGLRLHSTRIAGGLVSLTPYRGAALGVSGKNGLYRIAADGACGYFPGPLRTRFDGVWVDSRGRCWAGYTGGLLLIEGSNLKDFREPGGVGGFRVTSAAPWGEGGMVFLCTLPTDPWYQSGGQSPFLLLCRGGRWERVTLAKGLPGQVSAVSAVGGRVFLSSSAGAFQLVR